ncbi:hypothetical protein [Actinomadura sp. NPDC000929]|uniref:hypothetical protein n=1 Tax=Actinomadura sp. NPDC000929 TaxID=3154517 RepID=UPI003390DA9F
MEWEAGAGSTAELPLFSYNNTLGARASREADRLPACACGWRCCLLLLSLLLSPVAMLPSASQSPDMPLVLACPAALGAVDENDLWVGSGLVQLHFERIGVVLDERS